MVPVPEAYQQKGVVPDRLPTACSEYQPAEYLFNWLGSDLKSKAGRGREHPNWTVGRMEQEIRESLSRVDYSMVQGFYRQAYRLMFPYARIPPELRD